MTEDYSEYRNHNVKKSRHKRGLTMSNTGHSTLSTASSIPSKYQRIIIRNNSKEQNLSSPQKLSHQRSSSVQLSAFKPNNGPNPNDTSQTFLSPHEISKRLHNTSTHSNQYDLNQSFQSHSTGFGASAIRFDNNYELQLMFNKSPGPGTYNLRKMVEDQVSQVKLELINSSPRITENQHSLNSTSQMNPFQNQSVQYLINSSKSKIYTNKRLRNDQSQFEGPGFPKALRFQERIEQSPGPQQYDPTKPQEKHKSLVKMQNEGKISIPSHILNNPLNYVKPLIVNLYYKKQNPDVGAYDVTHPEEIAKKLNDNVKFSYKSVFESKQERKADFLINGDQTLLFDENKKDFYEVEENLKALNKDKLLMPTPAFQQPLKPYIKQDFPQTLQQLLNKDKEQDASQELPQPHYYGSLDDKLARAQYREALTNDKILSKDRFGNQVLPKKPIEELPGPGYYNDNINYELVKPHYGKSPVIQPEHKMKSKVVKEEIRPSPAQYNQEIEPKQVSFHFWGNQGEIQPWIH
ncbi:UNKNOWN [Stylonychia lemnae]|uniref:Uncharacterized protein n=1 Tax=Stylonychia lemnae TaxID=5949 RepID=A0A078APX8_STYLE|nr:UNKNOWN [Stylonychia lemnae]|eukprot:CDW84385.1 UNKNOWN [Stylonychia lemnae]